MKLVQSPYRELLDELLAESRRYWGVNLVSLVVYGSVARGDFRKDSDIDLLIVCRDLPAGKLRRQELFIEVEKRLDLESLYDRGYSPAFSPLLKTVEEAEFLSPLYLDMVEDAIILYDPKGFFRNVLERLRRGLKKLGAKRIPVGARWYWDLKPGYEYGEDVVIE